MLRLSCATVRSRAVVCLACAAFAPLLAAAPAGAASLGGNSLTEQAEREGETTATTSPTPKTGTPEATNSHTTILIATGAAVLLLVGIAFVIVRDARRVAPAGDPETIERNAARDTAAQLHKRRAKAKAARRQRKRTR